MTDITPCPFCDSMKDASVSRYEPFPAVGIDLEYYCLCPGCGTKGPVASTDQGAIEKWNRQGVETGTRVWYCPADAVDGRGRVSNEAAAQQGPNGCSLDTPCESIHNVWLCPCCGRIRESDCPHDTVDCPGYWARIVPLEEIMEVKKKFPDLFVPRMFGEEVDLNDPETYTRSAYTQSESTKFGGTTEELWWKCLTQIGYAHMYTNYFHPPTESSPDRWESQLPQIHVLCKEFAAHERDHRFEDSEENRLWFKKWLYRFCDEIENMC